MKLRLVHKENSAESANHPPRRRPNVESRSREYLTLDEVRRLRAAARKIGRYGFRDSLLIGVMFRHGLRVAEAVALTWDSVHFDEGTIHVQRVKRGKAATHYMPADEIRELRRLQREQTTASRFVFTSERRGPLSTRSVHAIVQRAGEEAGIVFPVHPHQLRHAKGYALANKGTATRAIQDYLGHRDIKSTVGYTALAPNRLKGLEED